jgi:hypothetical protein
MQLRIRSIRSAFYPAQLVCQLVLAIFATGWSQTQPTGGITASNFDGKWWSKVGEQERFGFLNGAADCLTWKAHEKGFSATPEQIKDGITRFYKSHPESADLTVIDIWRRVTEQPPQNKNTPKNGETWKNPHWYLDGYWWRQGSETEQRGFLEGYLWCMHTCAPQTTETYSSSVNYYWDKISDYLQTHPKTAYRQAIADTLAQFCDKPSR